MIMNLPVLWRVQVLGGDAVCLLMRRLFPHEIAAGKVVVTHIDKDNVEQSRISEILTDPTFYNHLLGDTWLFFQVTVKYRLLMIAKFAH
ncbi:hypothetical protein VYU27_009030 [Nannochloropsis oceanica]